MIGLVIAAALAALGPRPAEPPQLSIPRDTVPRDVSPDPRPPARPEPRR